MKGSTTSTTITQGLAHRTAFGRFFVALLVFVLAFALTFVRVPMFAYAEEEGEAEANLINPFQQPDSSFIYDTLISDLATADSYLDGQTVQVTGEVVGDAIAAEGSSDHCWLTVQATDESYAQIATYVTKDSARLVDTFGAYGKKGTVLQVRGTFNLSCKEHQGLSDLHADSISVVSPGNTNPDEFIIDNFIVGAVLLLLGLVLVLVFYRLRERRR